MMVCKESGTRSLRVLHFLADGRVGGPGVRISRVHEGMCRLSNNGVQTFVACPEVRPEGFYDRFGIEHTEFNCHRPTIENPMRSGLRWITAGLVKDVHACRRILSAVRPTVVHINGAILIAPVLACRIARAPTVWHLNDVMVPKRMIAIVRTLSTICAAQIIVSSRAVIEHYGLPSSTPIIYPPAPRVTGLAGVTTKTAKGFKIGILANISPKKRIDLAIRALALLKAQHPDIHVEIAGRVLDTKYYYYEKLLNHIASLNLGERVKFLGFVRDVESWLKQLDLLVFPSESESAGMAVIEAMSVGVPVITADIPASREIGGDAVIFFPAGDAPKLADRIRTMVTDESVMRHCIRRGLDRAISVFGSERVAERQTLLYEGLLEQSTQ